MCFVTPLSPQPVNILFVNYGDFTTNSLNHIGGFANTLCASGHACAVVVPDGKDTLKHIAAPLFIAATYDEALARPNLFPDGRPADVIHAWTPRECVRRFTVAYQRAARTPARVLIHLEDNERFLLESYTGRTLEALRALPVAEIDALLGDNLPHPVRYESFLRIADGVTHIVDRLAEFAPPGVPTHLLFPGVDFAAYRPQEPDAALRAELGLREDEKVVVFTGSNTFANEPEMRELYVAVALLNQRGTPVRLVRTGFNSPRFLAGLSEDIVRHVLDLGFVEKAKLPRLLALADLLVQPGHPGTFNDYRLPSKLPEFLASGRPVVLPPTNLATLMQDGREAVFLPAGGTPAEIADTCERLLADAGLRAQLGENGAAFARAHFDLAKNTAALAGFYGTVAARPPAVDWSLAVNPSVTEATLYAASLAGQLNHAADSIADTAARQLAAQTDLLAGIVRELEEGVEIAAARRTAVLEADRDAIRENLTLTRQHADNLEKLLEAARVHATALEQSRDSVFAREKLTLDHIANVETILAATRKQVVDLEQEREAVLARERLAQKHIKNLDDLLAAAGANATALEQDRDAARLREEQAQQHARNLEEILAATRAHAAAVEQDREAVREAARQHGIAVEKDRDAALEAARAHIAAVEQDREAVREAARQHAAAVEQDRDVIRASEQRAQEHARNLETLLAASRTHIAELEKARELTQAYADNLEKEAARQKHRREQADTLLRTARQQVTAYEDALISADAEIDALKRELVRFEGEVATAREETAAERTARAHDREVHAQALAQAQAAHAGELAAAAAKLAEAEAVIRAREAKIAKMSASFSWQATSPLRALRRLLIDKRDAPSTPAPAAPVSGQFHSNIDRPQEWAVIPATLNLHGWTLRADKAPIRGIRARLGETVVNAQTGVERLDVLDHFRDFPGAEHCGWMLKLAVPKRGTHHLVLEAQDESGAWTAFFHRTIKRTTDDAPPPPNTYASWVATYDRLTPEIADQIRRKIAALPKKPLISVLMPVYIKRPEDEKWLIRAIESVRNQLYPHWELCISDDASPAKGVRKILASYQKKDPARIKVVHRETNGHICANSNSALALAHGEFIALLDNDDEIRAHALACVALEINAHPDADLIYSDEDKIDENGDRYDHYFKPDWNPDLFNVQNFISHLGVYRTLLVREVGGFRVGYEGSQDWDLAMRVIERSAPDRIRHIPKVLYHWRSIPGSTAMVIGAKSYATNAAEKVITEHFARIGVEATITPTKGSYWRVHYPVPSPAPRVTLVIPTRNRLNVLKPCIESLLAKTTYPNFEILIVDNDSDESETLAYLAELAYRAQVRVVRFPGEFNYSAINNYGVAQTDAPLIGLLNNDLEVIHGDWLDEMVSHALRPEIGCVGAKLYYPDDKIQHAGVILGIGGVAAHAWQTHPRGAAGQAHRNLLQQNLSAVTAACLVIRREVYLQVGGLEAEKLKVAFNDVDFCLKVRAAGYRNFWTPYAELYHHESASRGKEDTLEKRDRFRSEVEYMRATWADVLDHDPAYNPNLTLTINDFTLAVPPREWPPLQEANNSPSVSS